MQYWSRRVARIESFASQCERLSRPLWVESDGAAACMTSGFLFFEAVVGKQATRMSARAGSQTL
eukprot:scaffold33041_cov38-Attheya_sp.AAC.2